jgi:hypothetical protein
MHDLKLDRLSQIEGESLYKQEEAVTTYRAANLHRKVKSLARTMIRSKDMSIRVALVRNAMRLQLPLH